MSVNLQTKVDGYIKSEGLKLVPYDFVLEKMLSENKLTKAEYDELMQISLFQPNFTLSENSDDINGIWGLSLSKPIITSKEPDNNLPMPLEEMATDYVSKVNNELSNIKDFLISIGIPFNEEGELLVDGFTIDFIKTLFNENEYEIGEAEDIVSVINKNTNDIYSFAKDGSSICKIKDDKLEMDISFSRYKKLSKISIENIQVFFNEEQRVSWILVSSPQIDIRFDANQRISKIEYCDENYNVLDRKLAVVDDLVKLKDSPEDFYNLLTEKMNRNNVGTILTDFKDKTGIDLLDFYSKDKSEMGVKILNYIRSRFITFIHNADSYENQKKAELIADKLKIAIDNNDQIAFNDAMQYIQSDTIYHVMNTYRKNMDEENRNASPPKFHITTLIENIEASNFKNKEYYIMSIVNILNAAELDQADPDLADFMLREMPKILKLQTQKGAYIDDALNDFEKNAGDAKKQLIDFKRIVSRNVPVAEYEGSRPNGKFDEAVWQGVTGDCWLLAGLISIYKKENGKKYLESLIQPSFLGDKVIVRLPGVGRAYEITWEEIKSAHHLSKGDSDVRALEIAIDKYIKEMAYDMDYLSNIDINGNNLSFVYDLLIGKTNPQEFDGVTDLAFQEDANGDKFITDELIAEFNNPDCVYTLAFPEVMLSDPRVLDELAVIEWTGQKIDLIQSHAYAVMKSDDKYVYLINPHNSEITLRVEISKLKTLPAMVGTRVLNNNRPFLK